MGIDLGPNLSVTGSFSNDSVAHRPATGEPSGQRVELFKGRRGCDARGAFAGLSLPMVHFSAEGASTYVETATHWLTHERYSMILPEFFGGILSAVFDTGT
jgi:hypothetical protein